MPTDVQVILQGTSNLAEDRYINTLHFDGDDWDTARIDELWAKYNTMIQAVGGGLATNGHEIRCYQPGLNPGGPYVSKKLSLTLGQPNGGPGELAVCLSYAAVDDPEASTARRRGRIYCGPLRNTNTDTDRPDAAVIDAVLDLGEGIATVGFAANTTWALKSVVDNSYHKIESIWCDNAWDIQRRRGLRPTAKTVRDVQ